MDKQPRGDSTTGSASSRLTIYVAHHRPATEPLPALPYVAVCNIRSDGSRPPGFREYDDEGGLPHLNSSYNELSVLHRLQARAQTDWVGLAHYRRVLLARRPIGRRGEQPGTTHVRGWDWQHPERWSADEASLLGAMGTADWATPVPYDVRRAGYRNLWRHWHGNHPYEVLEQANQTIRRLHPEWQPFESWLRGEVRMPLFNIFFGRRDALHRYGDFLWPVLASCAGNTSLAGYQGRWAGFLGERLHAYWLDVAARPGGVRVAQLPLAILDGRLPTLRQRATAVLPPALTVSLRSRLRPSTTSGD